jgi:hypothetical protein
MSSRLTREHLGFILLTSVVFLRQSDCVQDFQPK